MKHTTTRTFFSRRQRGHGESKKSIKTKSIYYDKKEPSDGKRILITRYYPRGVKRDRFDLWVREASPEIPLLKEYRSDKIDWKEFSREFQEQMKNDPETKKALNELISLSEKGTITLLCYEKEGENCHRNIVKSYLTKKKESTQGHYSEFAMRREIFKQQS